MRVDEIQILLDQGRIALNQGRFDEASELIDRVLVEDGHNEQALNLRGLLFFKQDRFKEAVDLFKNLVQKHPDEPTLLMNLGLAYLKSEQYQDAIRELTRALQKQPSNSKILNYMGLAYSGIGRLKEAQAYFLQAGSTKMADQMLQLMKEKSGEDKATTEEEVEIDTEELSASVAANSTPSRLSAEDTLDRAFGATFGVSPPPPAAAPPAPASATLLNKAAVPTNKTVEAAAKAPTPVSTAPVPAPSQTMPVQSVVSEPPDAGEISVDAVGDEVLAAGAEVKPETAAVPTDLLGSAMALLKDRYETVLETAAAGQGLRELAKLLELSKDPNAAIEQIRPNILCINIVAPAITMARMSYVLAIAGDVRAEARQKRYKGKDIKSSFGGDKDPVYELVGSGAVYVTAPPQQSFFLLRLDRELVYIVEDVFFAMHGEWRWENGRLPGKGGNDLHLLQLRGEGTVALLLREQERLGAIQLKSKKLTLPVSILAGWYGNIVPVLVDLNFPNRKQIDGAVQFQGDGTVLLRTPGYK